ncbi:hypothetical protein C5Y97_14040 [Blastopirellula marina]|uniref:Carboxypeptidase regulatory-like domain-containing protein n=2 Tax=Blastopirellula marina TaxID=124 RepID=A0A2S8GA92_9BACT|nr:hypothetical protein C5Y98_14030 [Blastopirellula marina]PQO41353.1 hypothetical protein C5Y93_30005 [Blastopirellula marina]PTL44114.1 hypothetical protein C5Y97_14040 [Blastopirellula marina]
MLSLLPALLLAAMVGCGGDGKSEVHGVATWNGQPIEKGYLELAPVDGAGQFASAEIADGKFTLRTIPGMRQVKVTAERKIGETAPTERIPNPEPIMFQYLPAKYNSQSEWKIDIKAGEDLTLDMTGEELAPQKLSSADMQRKARQGGN